ncbi:helix-turn-helix domain-containing protein [Methylobacterium sp. CCH5-D2]|uniref:helix-turn-helix domain-containing protein n=1 Tax=Methylobacterium sp. CCH5-D2 TaxID=1768765 RepID=UPI0008330638|nr:helix-turn-helix domain-containing protein [Methylobacterium sp. CCH5-D2]
MDNEPWQRRAKATGLSQVTLARLLGRPPNTISRQIRGEQGDVPQHLVAVIIAWEMMTPDQREEWVAATRRACGLP